MFRCISPRSGEIDLLREFTSSAKVGSTVFAWIQGPTERIELRVFAGRVLAV